MFKHLLAQRITRYNEQWYCYLCNSPQLDLEKAKSHLQETHLEQISTTNQILEFLKKSDISNKQCNKLLYAGVVLQNLPHDYFCIICQCHIPTLNHVYEHVNGRKHERMKAYKKASIEKKNLTNAQQNLSRKQSLVGETMVKLVEQLDNLAIREPTVIYPDQLAESSNANGKNLMTDCIKVNNGLLDYFCIICKCWIPTLSHVCEHVKGKNHQIQRASTTKEKPQNDPIIEATFISPDQLVESSNANSKNLMTDCIKVNNGLLDYFCIICKCWIPTLSHVCEHVKGKNHQIQRASTKEKPQNDPIIEPTFISPDQLTESLNANGKNLMTDCIKLNNGLQDYFCIICKCWIPTLSHVCEHVKGKNHQIQRASITKEKPQNDTKSSNNNTDNTISTLEEVGTSETQTLICTMATSINTSVNMSLVEHNVSKTQKLPYVDNVHFPVAAANTNKQDITLLQDKKTTSGLFIPPDLSNEIYTSLNTMSLSKTTVLQKKTASEHYNRMYQTEYLRFEKIMFSCCEWKLNKIKENWKFYIPSTDQSVICLICNVKHSSCDIQLWYEHISCNKHKNKQLLNIKSILLEQLISNNSETNVICHACSTEIDKNARSIQKHINEASHKMHRNKLLTQLKSLNYYHNLSLKTLDPLWYAIQYFACVPCRKRFKIKVEFMDHLYKRHKFVIVSNSCKEFGFCVICAILWYENKTCSYSKHCSHPIHLYLKKSNDFAVKPLPQEVIKLLEHIDQNVTDLFKASEDVSIKLNTNRIINDLKHSLESHHLFAVQIHIYGSRCTGLALLNSDIDIYLDFGGECTEAELIKSRSKQIEECLRVDYEVWKIKEVLENTRTPIIKLIHISTGINCDISYMNGLSVENSKFIKSFNNAYLPCRKLILFLKKWMQLCNFTGSEKITNYALVWLVIFYLQVKHGIPSVASLIKRHKELKIISGWRICVNHTFTIDIPKLPMYELLLGFFQYYGEFDYMHSVICPLLGSKCDKHLFTYLDKKSTFPEDMEPYVTHLQGVNPEFFRVDSAMCVQDPFVLSYNITRAVPVLTLRSFKEYCKKSESYVKLHFAN